MLDLSLAEVAAQCAELLGRETELAGDVVAYGRAHELVNAYTDKRRKATIRRAQESAVRYGSDRDSSDRIIAVRWPARTVRELRSAPVKEKAPALWKASQITQVRLAVKTIESTIIAAPRTATVTDLIATMRSDREKLKAARGIEAVAQPALVSLFLEIDTARPWGGDPLATSDGWLLGYSAVDTFNGARCRELAPEYGVDVDMLLIPKDYRETVRYQLASAPSDGDGDAE